MRVARGGLLELRRELERNDIVDLLWYEIPKSKHARRSVKRALEADADLIFVWGGDGTVQRCIDAAAGSGAALAIVPAGTANLLAGNLEIPQDIERAVEIGLLGERRKLDVGRFDGERFGVMAGAGFDAAMIHQADGSLKDRFGRLAYIWTGSENLRTKPFRTTISIDGTSWYKGRASCILIGNVGNLFGGIKVFKHASPDDGRLEVGVVNADGIADWARMLARTAAGHPEKSPFTRTTSARKIDVKLDRKVLYEIDGGDRLPVKSFKVRVEPRAVSICVPKNEEPPMMRTDHTISPVLEARSAGEGFVQTRAFEVLSRAGFVARGVVYGIIGLLALDLAVGQGGKITNQQGALRTIEHQPFGHLLLALVAIGLGGYSLWRLFRAALGHGPEGADSTLDRLGALRERDRLRADVRHRRRDPDRAPVDPPETPRRRRGTYSRGRQATGSSESRGSS